MKDFQSPFGESISDTEEDDGEPYLLDDFELVAGDEDRLRLIFALAGGMQNAMEDGDGDSTDDYSNEDNQEEEDNKSSNSDSDDDFTDSDNDSGSGTERTVETRSKTAGRATTGDSGEGSTAPTPRRVIDDYDEDMEEDEVVKAIIAEIKKPRSKPPDIRMEDFVVDLSFHPRQDILAIGTSVGDVQVYRYTNDENTLLDTHELHTKSVRGVEFSRDGRLLISTGRDRSILVTDTETGKLTFCWEEAHEEPVYTMSIIGEHTFATGDDDGVLKMWDVRQKDAVFKLKPVEDFISAILSNAEQQKYLLMTSGDGFLTTINIAQRKMHVQSEPYEEELNCMGLFKRESKLVVGTSKGNCYTFNWEQFAYHCDAFTGPKAGANRMIPITEQIAVMAGEDGVIRAMHMVPGRMLGIVGQHAMAVDTMDISGSGELIASSSQDNDVRFWNVKYFEDFDDIKYNAKPDKRALKHNLPSSQRTNARDFFADMDDD
ncbi:WD repeat-containing protein 55 homolog [Anopheles albimanus]|uniref:WD repeat-containing protein 55 homolog n=1 Tax=Anopheles albimanus TaxID=7167 RepID=UPI001642010C|nr:WD repeat-containing protein 55 homolog [Anopheles albimanus]